MIGANDIGNKSEFHLILICNEAGIFEAFKILKERLRNRRKIFLSLIYSVPESYQNPLFANELTILEKRFSHHLYAYTLKLEPGKYDLIQESIEAIINSNTMLEMQFLVFGNNEFADYVTGVLEYLNVNALSVQSNIK